MTFKRWLLLVLAAFLASEFYDWVRLLPVRTFNWLEDHAIAVLIVLVAVALAAVTIT